jgi:serine/threonine-protein kinase HipA
MKLAMFVGDSRHYRNDDIEGRHFIQTAERAGLPRSLAIDALQEVAKVADAAMKTIPEQLPPGFPEGIHTSVKNAFASRLRKI